MTGYDLPLTPIIIRTMHKRLMYKGYTCAQACNLLARLMGLKLTHKDWTLKQLTHLMFEQYMDERNKGL